QQVKPELDDYCNDKLRQFTLPIEAPGTEFQESVWQALLRIPYGEMRSYAAIAEEIGQPTAVRAVGRANGDNRIAIIIPCHRVVSADGELTGYGGGLWRKNRNTLLSPDIGVDLNRNYGYQWGYDNSGSSPIPGSQTYRGASAFSEPETANMRAFINSREFTFVINYHAYSDLWLWPWGYDYIYTPDELLFYTIGDSIRTFNGYTPEIGWSLYATNGDCDDWVYGATGEHGRALPFTPEVGSAAEGGFWPDPIYIPSQIEENQAPNLLLIDLADAPERVFPAAVPVWTSPADADTTFFDLTWSDPGGPNAAASFELREIFGIQRTDDDVESGTGLWTLDGFSVSTSRAASGSSSYFGGADSWLQSRLSAKNYLHVETDDTLKTNIWYDIENGWDYGYVEVSIDGGGFWAPLEGNVTTNDDPHGNNRGNGITGSSGAFVPATFPLNTYAGMDILIRLSYVTDGFVLGEGIYFDDISPLVDFDSVTVLEPATTQTTYAVTGKDTAVYSYDLSATDGDGQTSVVTAPHYVTVSFNDGVCDCPCHGDATCDSTHDVFDVVNVVGVAFRSVPPTTDPLCPLTRTDVNCDTVDDVVDVVITVGVAFRNDDPAAVYCDPCTGP
ncbi:MAG: methylated-DNA--[protein]-cysteine S-methyltransferase, partial [Acidobacteria bacterium]|nr:methylated-DNA--[protein]-cysteine S-methyltransferase [Acidobacteriota bacterium]